MTIDELSRRSARVPRLKEGKPIPADKPIHPVHISQLLLDEAAAVRICTRQDRTAEQGLRHSLCRVMGLAAELARSLEIDLEEELERRLPREGV